MLTEKEIEQIIALHWDTQRWTNWMEVTAAAIAKRLSEGVVWEAKRYIRVLPIEDSDDIASYLVLDPGAVQDAGQYMWLTNSGIARDGQLVEVIVRKVEGTKNENEERQP